MTTLVIGSKTYSSWSLRPWLFLKHHGIAFRERKILFSDADWRAQIRAVSPNSRVPLLIDGDLRVWESIAICEYVAERDGVANAWPESRAARASARSLANEMHAGFADLRNDLTFHLQRPRGPARLSSGAQRDIARVRALWREARLEYGARGDWLFGGFGIVDAMFAPVALRFHAYAIPLSGWEAAYVETMRAHPAIREWITDAQTEPLEDDYSR